jgi:hypothetical protein
MGDRSTSPAVAPNETRGHRLHAHFDRVPGRRRRATAIALSYREPEVRWFHSELWSRLTPQGARYRNIGIGFWVAAAVAFGVGWVLLPG